MIVVIIVCFMPVLVLIVWALQHSLMEDGDMRNGYYDGNAKCPFYLRVVSTKDGRLIGIACESLGVNLGFDIQTLVRFRSRHDLVDYFDIFCGDMYQTCPYSQALHAKYEEKKDDGTDDN